jgi:molybdopterin synthase catalytic subunit
MLRVRVQEGDIDVAGEMAALRDACPQAGALGSFLGIVRSTEAHPIEALTLEHYPRMTQAAIERMARDAIPRFALLGCTVIHRVGTLRPGACIVLVLAASLHRQAALDGTGFLIDWLKTDAPFWKKEHFAGGGTAWVEARCTDEAATARWA